MAAGIISRPGTQYGPCANECQHIDCAEQRKWSEKPCVICGKPIGYEIRFYRNDEGFAHALCAEEQVEIAQVEN